MANTRHKRSLHARRSARAVKIAAPLALLATLVIALQTRGLGAPDKGVGIQVPVPGS